MPRLVPLIALILLLFMPGQASAGSLEVTVHSISAEGVGAAIGSVQAHDSDQGLVITPSLQGLSEGEHGFHLHAGDSCDAAMNGEGEMVAGLAAKGHWDPDEARPICVDERWWCMPVVTPTATSHRWEAVAPASPAGWVDACQPHEPF
jgi:hypothetical protein